jgi:hypothetical protein
MLVGLCVLLELNCVIAAHGVSSELDPRTEAVMVAPLQDAAPQKERHPHHHCVVSEHGEVYV